MCKLVSYIIDSIFYFGLLLVFVVLRDGNVSLLAAT